MKTLNYTLLALCLAVCFHANAQYSLSSVQRLIIPPGSTFSSVPAISIPAPGTPAEAGPDYSAIDVTSRPVWFMISSCGTNWSTYNFGIKLSQYNFDARDSVSMLAWGPLTDTTNLISKLNASNLFFSYNDHYYNRWMSSNISVGNIPTNPKGSTFIILVCSTDSALYVQPDSGPIFAKIDNSCGICHGKVTTLDQYLCIVAYDTASGKNMPVWVKGDSTNLESYNIYREGSALNQFDSLGNVQAAQPSLYIDHQVNPGQQSFKYAVSGRDSCGNTYMGNGSVPYQNTIYLQSNLGLSGEVNLSWNAYYGAPFLTYYIWRGTSQNNISLIDSIASSNTAYTDFNAPAGANFYRVSIVNPGGCQVDSSTVIYSSRSNVSSLTVVGVNENSAAKLIRISPNPAHNEIFIDYSSIKEDVTSIDLIDVLGNVVQTWQAMSHKRHNLIFNAPPGSYFIKINTVSREIRKKFVNM